MVVKRLVDTKGRTRVEVYHSSYRKKRCYRYRVIGGNGERMAASQAYPTLQNAMRGASDLIQRLTGARLNWK